MNTVYEIVEVTGFGTVESPIEHCGTGLIFADRVSAVREAAIMWKEKTTEQQRQSSWCPLHYTIREITVKQ